MSECACVSVRACLCVCYRMCEIACVKGIIFVPVSIRSISRTTSSTRALVSWNCRCCCAALLLLLLLQAAAAAATEMRTCVWN